MYSKGAERGAGAGDVRTRIELQLCGPKIAKRYGLADDQRLPLGKLTVAAAYAVLREFVSEFKALSIAAPYSNDQLLAHAIVCGVRAPDGRHLLDWRTDGMEQLAAKRLRRKIEATSMTMSGFCWETFLPANPTPAQLAQLTDWSPPRRPGDAAA